MKLRSVNVFPPSCSPVTISPASIRNVATKTEAAVSKSDCEMSNDGLRWILNDGRAGLAFVQSSAAQHQHAAQLVGHALAMSHDDERRPTCSVHFE